MSLSKTRKCRFCEQSDPLAALVRFGSRQYAHPGCGLDRMGTAFVAALDPTQLARIPVGVAIQYRVLDAIERSLAA
jgi:hypothetical protein